METMLAQPFTTKTEPGNVRVFPGGAFTYLARGEQTDGAFALIRAIVRQGAEPPPHVHANEAESYFIEEGEMTYFVGEETYTVRAGEFIHLPKGIPHAFKAQTPVVRKLMWLTPAGLDEWFWENSEPSDRFEPPPVPQGPPPPEAVEHFVRTLGEYGVEMV